MLYPSLEILSDHEILMSVSKKFFNCMRLHRSFFINNELSNIDICHPIGDKIKNKKTNENYV